MKPDSVKPDSVKPDSVEQSSAIKIDIWSDVVCPWCYIGKRRFEQGLAAAKAKHPDLQVEVEYHAFQLDPNAPVDSSQTVPEVYAKKFGGAERAGELMAHMTAEAAAVGLEFRLDIAQRSNTVRSHRLLALAASKGLQAELKERLLLAYFSEGVNVGDPEKLVELGVEVGLDRAEAEDWLNGEGGNSEVARDLEAAADNDITAVPTFVFNEAWAVPGALDAANFERVLVKLHEREKPA